MKCSHFAIDRKADDRIFCLVCGRIFGKVSESAWSSRDYNLIFNKAYSIARSERINNMEMKEA